MNNSFNLLRLMPNLFAIILVFRLLFRLFLMYSQAASYIFSSHAEGSPILVEVWLLEAE